MFMHQQRPPAIPSVCILIAILVQSGCSGDEPNGRSKSGGTGGALGNSGSAGTGANSGSSGGLATGGSAGNAGMGATGGQAASGSGGVSGTGGSAGTGGAPGSCGTFAWACWPMPNAPETGLPNPAAYTDLGAGTVRDDVTGLVWQKAVDPSTHTWTQALAYCAALDIAGGGFRLPRRIELLSIVDHVEFSPTIDEATFPGTPAGFFWTASPWAVNATPLRSWIVNFADGLTSNNGFQTGSYSARCVRGGPSDAEPSSAKPPPNLYVTVGTGEMRDQWTGLVWQQASSGSAMTFANAEAHCRDLNLNGQSWRLPSVNELSTLVDETRVAPAIQIATFADTRPNDWYWSATSYANNAAIRWCINYNDGYTSRSRAQTELGWVRCVR